MQRSECPFVHRDARGFFYRFIANLYCNRDMVRKFEKPHVINAIQFWIGDDVLGRDLRKARCDDSTIRTSNKIRNEIRQINIEGTLWIGGCAMIGIGCVFV